MWFRAIQRHVEICLLASNVTRSSYGKMNRACVVSSGSMLVLTDWFSVYDSIESKTKNNNPLSMSKTNDAKPLSSIQANTLHVLWCVRTIALYINPMFIMCYLSGLMVATTSLLIRYATILIVAPAEELPTSAYKIKGSNGMFNMRNSRKDI